MAGRQIVRPKAFKFRNSSTDFLVCQDIYPYDGNAHFTHI
jgi:hypothetical protein